MTVCRILIAATTPTRLESLEKQVRALPVSVNDPQRVTYARVVTSLRQAKQLAGIKFARLYCDKDIVQSIAMSDLDQAYEYMKGLSIDLTMLTP